MGRAAEMEQVLGGLAVGHRAVGRTDGSETDVILFYQSCFIHVKTPILSIENTTFGFWALVLVTRLVFA